MSAGVLVLDVALFDKLLRLCGPEDGRPAVEEGVLFHAVKDDPTIFASREEAEAAITRTIAFHSRGSILVAREEYEVLDVAEYEARLAGKSKRKTKTARAGTPQEGGATTR